MQLNSDQCCVTFPLDLTISSELVMSKLRDIPPKEKSTKITQPIFTFIENRKYYPLSFKQVVITENLDVIRDRKFIIHEMVEYYNKCKSHLIGIWREVVSYLKLWNEREFVLEMMKKFGYLLDGFVKKEEFLEDREIILYSIRSCYGNYSIVKEKFRNDKEITMIAVGQSPDLLRYASEAMKADRDVVKIALLQSGYAFKYISEEVKKDREFISSIFNHNKDMIEYIYSF